MTKQISNKKITNKGLLVVSVVIISVVLIGWAAYYYGSKQAYDNGYSAGYEKGKEVGRAAAKVEAGKVVSNPMENMPSANPFEKAVNPYEEAYKNPFE